MIHLLHLKIFYLYLVHHRNVQGIYVFDYQLIFEIDCLIQSDLYGIPKNSFFLKIIFTNLWDFCNKKKKTQKKEPPQTGSREQVRRILWWRSAAPLHCWFVCAFWALSEWRLRTPLSLFFLFFAFCFFFFVFFSLLIFANSNSVWMY